MRLIDEISQGLTFEIGPIRGYSDEEIVKIEIFYGIKIKSDLRRFFSEIGRSAGSVAFESFIIAYTGYYAPKTPANVSGHVASQLDFKDSLMKHGRPFSTGKPFLFSIENETQYVFLRTAAGEPLVGKTPEDEYSQLSADPDTVYLFDENQNTVTNTNRSLKEYLVAKRKPQPVKQVGAGEMIVI